MSSATTELTEEEIANGWTEESLKRYIEERERAQMGKIMFHPDFRSPGRKKFANNRYRPLRWR